MQRILGIDTNMNFDRINEFVQANKQELIKQRRWFHQHPETSYKEFETQKYISNYLNKLSGWKVEEVAGTGIMATLGNYGRVIACRFNMDGLEIREETGLSYTSVREDFSHSCGHDFELAWGLLIAKYFTENPPKETVRLLFQPAEEGPGDEKHCKTGGEVFAELGLFDVDGIFSLHVEPKYDVNVVSITSGEVTCDAFDFEITLYGKMGHAAKPEQAINPIVYSTKLVNRLYELSENYKVGMEKDEFFVLTVSDISTSNTTKIENLNTIPESTTISGITRIRSKRITNEIKSEIKKIIEDLEGGLTNVKFKFIKRAIATVNDPALVEMVEKTIGSFDYSHKKQKTTWRDDAGWASLKAPTAHGFIGVHQDNVGTLHSPKFNPNEDGLEVGLNIFLGSINQFLKSKQ